jgi:hypothetical protein
MFKVLDCVCVWGTKAVMYLPVMNIFPSASAFSSDVTVMLNSLFDPHTAKASVKISLFCGAHVPEHRTEEG